VTNTLAYYGTELITLVKSFIAQGPEKGKKNFGNKEKVKYSHKTSIFMTVNTNNTERYQFLTNSTYFDQFFKS
jgi:hypothetical protein